MERTNLRLFAAFSVAFLLQAYAPLPPLAFFIPPLIISIYIKPYTGALWLALVCGLVLDLMGTQSHLGVHATAYLLTMAALYGQKRNFFQDSLSTVPIMTFFFSALATVLTALFVNLLGSPISLTKEWLFQDVFLFSLLDALYGFILFTLPAVFLPRFPKREYFS